MYLWISLAVILGVAFTIGFFVWFSQRDSRYADPLISYLGMALFIGGGIWLLAGLMGGSMAAMTAATKSGEWTTDSKKDLVALATTTEEEGHAGFFIFLGYAYEGETRMVYWTERDAEGIVTMKSMEARDAMVREVETEPRVLRQVALDTSHSIVPWDVTGDMRTILEVPVGTLTANYEFQP